MERQYIDAVSLYDLQVKTEHILDTEDPLQHQNKRGQVSSELKKVAAVQLLL